MDLVVDQLVVVWIQQLKVLVVLLLEEQGTLERARMGLLGRRPLLCGLEVLGPTAFGW